MSDKALASYLNDHLAGAVSALELLEYLEAEPEDADVRRLAAELRAEVATDRQELERLMERFEISKSPTRRAASWVAEKAGELKLRLTGAAGGALALLEALDALSLGIEGKKMLWRVLAAAAQDAPALQGVDYDGLERRAEDQRRRVEVVREEAARQALVPESAPVPGGPAAGR
jgi:hypothetical protein